MKLLQFYLKGERLLKHLSLFATELVKKILKNTENIVKSFEHLFDIQQNKFDMPSLIPTKSDQRIENKHIKLIPVG